MAELRGAIDVARWQLKSGLRVVFVEDRRAPLVTVNAFYHVGSRDEKDGSRGFARLLAHVLDGETERLPEGARERLLAEAGGASTTVTADDYTAFQTTLPASQLGLALALEAERLRGTITARSIARAMDHIRGDSERPRPARHLVAAIARLRRVLFAGSPYELADASALALSAAPAVATVREFREQHATPASLTLVVVGDVRRGAVEREVAARFSDLSAGKAPRRSGLGVLAPIQAELSLTEPGARPIVAVGMRLPDARDADWPAIRVLTGLLGQGPGGLLHTRLVAEAGVAVSAGALLENLADAGALFAFALPAPTAGEAAGSSADSFTTTRAALEAALTSFVGDGALPVSPADLARTKHRLAMEQALALDTPSGLAALLGEAESLVADARRVNAEVAGLLAVTEADLRRVAARLLASGNRCVLVMRPSVAEVSSSSRASAAGASAAASPTTASPAASSEAEAQGPSAARSVDDALAKFPRMPNGSAGPGPTLQRQRLDNRLEVQILPRADVPLVTFRIGLRAGTADEDPSTPGLASVTAALLRAGSTTRTREQIEGALEAVGGTLSSAVSVDGVSLGCTVLAKDRDLCLDVLADLIQRPAFNDEDLRRLRVDLRNQLRERAASASSHALRNLDNLVFGDRHPQGRVLTGPHLDKIGPEDVAAFWRRMARPETAVLVVAGQVEPRSLLKAVEARFAGWRGGPDEPKARAVVRTPDRKGTRFLVVDRDDADGAALVVGQRLPGRADPAWASALLLATVLGGPSSEGRLSMALAAQGLAPDGAVVALAGQDFGRLSVTATVRPDGVLGAASLIAGELRRLRETQMPEAELSAAARRLVGQIAAGLAPGPRLVEQLAEAHLMGVGPEGPWKLMAEVGRLDPAAVRVAAERLFEPEQLVVVAEGPGDAVTRALDAAKLRYERALPRDPQSAGERAQRRRALLDDASSGALTRARALLRQGLDAQGGASRLAAIKEMKIYKSGTRREGDTLADMFATVYYQRPDRFRLEQEVVLPTGRTRQVVVVRPKGVKAGPLGGALAPVPPLNDRRMRAAVFEDALLILPHVLEAKPPLLVRLAPPREVEGKKLEGAFVRLPSGEWTALYFDAVTHLLARIEGEDEIGDPRVELLTDYREVAGCKLPFRQISPAPPSGGASSEALIKEIRVNPGLPAALFE